MFAVCLLALAGCAQHQAHLKPDGPHAEAPHAASDETLPEPLVATQGPEPEPAVAQDAPVDGPDELLAAQPEPPTDIWERIRHGFVLPDTEHPRVQPHVDWYARHQGYLDRVANRASLYIHHVVEEIAARDMPMELALLPVIESAYYPFAYSHGRASGIWQFIPMTGNRFGLKQTWWYDGRRDVYASTRAALDYLDILQRHFDGDWLLALAAYNAGEGTVMRAVRRNRNAGKPTDFWSLDLPRETRAYVPKLLALSRVVATPEDHGLTLTSIPNQPYFELVDVDGQLDLALAAELAEMPLDVLYQLNPAFNRWATDPEGPHYLLLPLDNAERFRGQLAELPPERRLRWERHRIRSGETLGTIARKYHTTVGVLQQANRLKGHVIRAGDDLLIPVAAKDLSQYNLTATQRQQAVQNRTREGTRVVHVVRAGDTLWDIARKHRVGVNELARWNSMAPRDVLRPGQRLVIWTSSSNASTAASAATASAVPAHRPVTQRIGYTVRPGDSLARISQRFNVTIDDLVRWNSLQRDKYLQPGQSLTLYVDVTNQAGNI